jgi:Tfp pilus assembly protein PilP
MTRNLMATTAAFLVLGGLLAAQTGMGAAAKNTASAAAKPVPKAQAPASASAPPAAPAKPAATPARSGRRDPFVSPVRARQEADRSNPVCTTGARCLPINQIVLKGVVKTPSGMIAMVENAARKQYNLRENDPVLNGMVLKITGDSIIFRETVTDAVGRPATREVVKRVTAPTA